MKRLVLLLFLIPLALWAQNQNLGNVTVNNLKGTTVVASVNQVINPTAPPYNAKCDGVTNDSAAIQAAINAIPPTGGSILIPGVCVAFGLTIPATIINGSGSPSLATGLRIHGLGLSTSMLINTSATTNTITATCSSGISCSNIKIEDLAFLNGQTSFNGWDVQTQNVSSVIIHNVSFTGLDPVTSHTCGVKLIGQVGIAYTFNEEIDQVQMAGCQLLFTNIDDSYVHGGMYFPERGTGGRQYAISLVNPSNIDISGVHNIGLPYATSGTCASVLITGASTAVSITNNMFDIAPIASVACYGIYDTGNTQSFLLSTNQFYSLTAGIALTLANTDFIISNNIFTNTSTGLANAGGIPVITIGGQSNGIISSNQFIQTNSLTTPIYIVNEQTASTTDTYSANTFRGVGFVAQPYAIQAGSKVLPISGAAVVNQATCTVSVGPPQVMGHCTSVISGTGSCTCAP